MLVMGQTYRNHMTGWDRQNLSETLHFSSEGSLYELKWSVI